jgi:uncharacterized protein (DUF433 family)
VSYNPGHDGNEPDSIRPGCNEGQAVVAGTRITVELILEKLAGGESVEQLLEAHPRLTREAVLAALAYAAEFIRHELPASFIEDLQADIADLEHAIGGQNTGRNTHVSATASIETVIERGMNAVRKLDAIVRNKFHNDPATLAAWESARHIESSARTRKRSNGHTDNKKSDNDKND